MNADLPEPSADAAAASSALTRIIAHEIQHSGGWISFARYMELALYAPGLGYYAGGARKFGDFSDGGDVMTAPELTPLFGQAVARQVAQILQQVPAGEHPMVIEVGGGSGRLAADLLLALDALDAAPERYLILEVSGELRARQATTVAEFAPALEARVEWLEHIAVCCLAKPLALFQSLVRVDWLWNNDIRRMENMDPIVSIPRAG